MSPNELTNELIVELFLTMPEILKAGLKGKAFKEHLAMRCKCPLVAVECFLGCEINYLINNLNRKAST